MTMMKSFCLVEFLYSALFSKYVFRRILFFPANQFFCYEKRAETKVCMSIQEHQKISNPSTVSSQQMQEVHKRRVLPAVALTLAAFFLPLLIRNAFGIPWVMFQNFTDGIFYYGYAMQFDELVRRVGVNYYSVRFGGILPDAIAFSLFGAYDGVTIVRYLFAGASCSLLFALFWLRGAGMLGGIAAALLWAMNPAAVRLQQTGYVEVAGTFFLLFGTGLLLFPYVSRLVAFIAGCFLGLSVWSHTHAALALFFLVPLIVGIRLETGWKSLVCSGLWCSAGVVFITVCGVTWFWVNYGVWDLIEPTKEVLRLISSGAIEKPLLSWGRLVKENMFWFFPIPLLVAFLALPVEGRFAWGAWFAGIGYVVYLTIDDILKQNYSLSLFYYFSFALPSLVFAQASIVAKLAEPQQASAIRSGLPIGLAVLGPGTLSALLSWKLFWMAGVPSLLLACAVASLVAWQKNVRSLTAVLCLAASGLLVAGSASSWLAMGHYWKADDRPLLKIAEKWIGLLPRNATDPTALRFWYPENPNDHDAKMLQSFFLHNFTRLRDESGKIIPFGPLAPETVRLLQKEDVRHLVILDKDPEVVRRGVEWVRQAGLPVKNVRIEKISARGQTMHTAHIVLAPPAFIGGETLPFGAVIAHKDARVRLLAEGVEVTSAPTKRGFDAFLEIPPIPSGSAVRVRFEVLNGQILLGLATGTSSQDVIVERKFSITPREIETVFSSDFTLGARYLFVRSFLPNGARSKVIIRNIEVAPPPKSY
jgi:hypothetical protein